MNNLDKNSYGILGLKRDANETEVKKAYRKAALEHHPDKGGTDEMFQKVQAAYDCLSDAIQRQNYDRDLRRYGLKDGMKAKGKRDTASEPPKFRKQHTMGAKMSSTGFGNQPKPTNVNIPDDLNALSVKQLKKLLADLGLKSDDCFEKQDMITRLEQFKRPSTDKSKKQEQFR